MSGLFKNSLASSPPTRTSLPRFFFFFLSKRLEPSDPLLPPRHRPASRCPPAVYFQFPPTRCSSRPLSFFYRLLHFPHRRRTLCRGRNKQPHSAKTFSFFCSLFIYTLSFKSFRSMTHFCIEIHHMQLHVIISWNALKSRSSAQNIMGSFDSCCLKCQTFLNKALYYHLVMRTKQ